MGESKLMELTYLDTVPELDTYFELRKSGAKNEKGEAMYTVAIRPQGAGNEKLLRKYGVGIAENGVKTCWLIREGDDFILPSFDGLEMTPPKWTPKSLDKKVIMVVYPVVKTDGRVEYLFGTREGIKPNLIAQIRQNALYAEEFIIPGKGIDKKKRDEFYERVNREFENLTVDEILNDPEWMKWVNPTYTSGGSKEQMILRKMKNNATKNYPKEYDNVFIADAVKNMFEDQDDSLKEDAPAVRKLTVDEKIQKTEEEVNNISDESDVHDFTVDDETGEVYETAPDMDKEPDLTTPAETEKDPF